MLSAIYTLHYEEHSDSLRAGKFRGSNPGLGGGARLSAPVQTGPGGPPSLLYNGFRVSFTGGKPAGALRWLPTPPSAEVKERVELYFYSPLGLRGVFQDELYFTLKWK